MTSEVSRILRAPAQPDQQVARQLLPLVYDELRRLATRQMAAERAGHTLSATALVHEAYLRLVSPEDAAQWNGRAHFFAAAAEAMRRILIDNARRKARIRHGGNRNRVSLDEVEIQMPKPEEFLALDESLTRFAVEEPVAARIVELRYFTGLSIDESADILGISRATANRHWAYAKAWLRCELNSAD